MAKTPVYAWKPGTRIAVAADVAGTEVERIRKKMGGTVKPIDIVDENRQKFDPLHPVFEWDNTKAAESWRCVQARHVMSCIVTVTGGEAPKDAQRTFVSVQVMQRTNEAEDTHPERVFTLMSEAMNDAVLRKQVLKDAEDSMRTFIRRFAGIAELFGVLDAMETTLGILSEEMPASG